MPVDSRAISLETAVEYHRNGKLREAEQIYRSLLKKERDDIDANYLLGLIELDRGRHATAASLITKARNQAPNNPLYHYNLGRAEEGEQRLREAEESYRKAIHHRHDYLEARYALACLYHNMGRLEEAVAEYKRLLRLNPELPAVYNNLGNALGSLGQVSEGLRHLRRAVESEPNFAQGWGNLGNLLQTIGETVESQQAFQRAIAIDPDSPQHHYNYGNLLQMCCDYDGAIAQYQQALQLDPTLSAAHNNLGNVYKLQGKLRLAQEAFETAIRHQPNSPDPLNNLGNVQVAAGDIDAAIVSYREAIKRHPKFVDAYSNLVYALNYPSHIPEAEIFAQHREWSERFEWPVAVDQRPPRPPLNGRKLRIGYISGDFRRHSVAFFFEPLLEAHDRSQVEIFCYANIRFSDDVTQRIMQQCHWRPITGLDDNQAAALIRKDRIDVLVDLSGHTDGNRLLIFARRPAPLQLTWLGYPNTTGLNSIDYRLIDAITDPPGEADTLASEQLYRLPHGFLCYRGYELAPHVLPPPSLRTGYLTFGSFNNLTKVTPDVVALWAKVLQQIPDSRLLMKTNQLEDHDTRERYYQQFADHGIPRQRLDLRARTAGLAEHHAVYGEVDIALDTFPYNGTTTTCEALWMGVPVIALAGNSHRARVSQSILTHAGLPQWIASDPDDLIHKITTLTADPTALRTQRAQMRRHLTASHLCDLNGFARAMETAYFTLF